MSFVLQLNVSLFSYILIIAEIKDTIDGFGSESVEGNNTPVNILCRIDPVVQGKTQHNFIICISGNDRHEERILAITGGGVCHLVIFVGVGGVETQVVATGDIR